MELAQRLEDFPERIENESDLEMLLSTPTQAVLDAVTRVDGDFLLLGVGGKMGPSLARMLRRACDAVGDTGRRIIGVSRFSNPQTQSYLERHKIETIQGDLLQEGFVASLPTVENVIFMTGAKFGTSGRPDMTWAMNVWLPSVVCQRFSESRFLAFSTGNVYPFVAVDSAGSMETDTLVPVGEYGMSALGRERMFEYFSQRDHIPTSIVRLNYAVEMRYGVLVDLAQKVLAGQEIDVSMGYANVIWQGDANAMAIAAWADASVPPYIVNVAGREKLDVAEVCRQFADHFDCALRLTGEQTPTALLSDATLAYGRYGSPIVPLQKLIEWTANWVKNSKGTLSKPTHFETRDGRF